MVEIPWLALGSFASGVGSVYLLARIGRHWDKPGARWFVATIAAITVWSMSYGVALLVAVPTVRLALETLTWLCFVWIGFCFFAFALGYTGRRAILESRAFQALALFPVAASVLAVTNPVHTWLWEGFQITDVGSVVSATYTFQPLGYGVVLVAMVLVSFGTTLVLDTVVSYGPLYRREALAVGLSPIPPGVAVLVWVLGVGPGVNLTTVAFLPHIALDIYAFVRSDMFEFHPATRRAGERAAIDDIATPVAIVDVVGRVVNLNPAAEEMLGVKKRTVLTDPLDARIVGDEFEPGRDDSQFSVENGGPRRQYKLQQTALRDSVGTQLGYTVVFQDITDELRRERRLEVLNRFLRHNVRNEGVVIQSRSELLAESLDGESVDHAETITRAVGRLVDSGDKARTLSEVSTDGEDFIAVGLGDLVDDVVGRLTGTYDGEVTVTIDDDLTVHSQPTVLSVVVTNLVENALEHLSDPHVTVTATVDGDEVLLAVADDGPGIPDHELSVLERGHETALAHGSGIGLWLIQWATTTLAGTLSFDTDDGTTATVSLPRMSTAASVE